MLTIICCFDGAVKKNEADDRLKKDGWMVSGLAFAVLVDCDAARSATAATSATSEAASARNETSAA